MEGWHHRSGASSRRAATPPPPLPRAPPPPTTTTPTTTTTTTTTPTHSHPHLSPAGCPPARASPGRLTGNERPLRLRASKGGGKREGKVGWGGRGAGGGGVSGADEHACREVALLLLISPAPPSPPHTQPSKMPALPTLVITLTREGHQLHWGLQQRVAALAQQVAHICAWGGRAGGVGGWQARQDGRAGGRRGGALPCPSPAPIPPPTNINTLRMHAVAGGRGCHSPISCVPTVSTSSALSTPWRSASCTAHRVGGCVGRWGVVVPARAVLAAPTPAYQLPPTRQVHTSTPPPTHPTPLTSSSRALMDEMPTMIPRAPSYLPPSTTVS